MWPDSINNKPTNMEDAVVEVAVDSEEVEATVVDTAEEVEAAEDVVDIIHTTNSGSALLQGI